MVTKNNIIWTIICFIIGFIIGIIITIKYNKYIITNEYNDIDTTYNKITLDSIKYNIIKKDSVITEIKKQFEYEKEQVLNASDSANVELFKQLAGSE